VNKGYTIKQYEQKIGTVLLGPEFEKLNENPFDIDLKEFHSKIELFEEYFDEKTMSQIFTPKLKLINLIG
jgi:hypothetical protein